jgi:asparagine synthase (glutamine-hydrolysing)
MCGIAGFIGAGNQTDIARMTRAIAHRGPDDESFFADPDRNLHFGFRRLSVLDHDGGKQPMQTGEGDLTVVFNGEIYNHRELRHILEQKGHRFVSNHSDTEVLLHGYREWGESLPERLNGMFAFAIYDRPRQRVFMARDRFGEKPVFLHHAPGLFAFASEIEALAAHQNITPDWDSTALQKYFAYGYFPAPHTPYRGIEKLRAGHYLVFDIARGTVSHSPYWTFQLRPDDSLTNEDELAAELRDHLKTAVNRRLEADVPLGFLLSGGIDSSAIVALAAEELGADNLQTFNIAFAEASFDESDHAATVAKAFVTTHHVHLCDLPAMRNGISELLNRMAEPLGDSSILPTHQVCAFARQHVTVALTGDGGDELFAGYDPFRALAMAKTYQSLVPGGLHRWIGSLVGRIPISDRNMSLDFKLRRTLRGLDHGPSLWNPVWMAPLAVDEIAELFETPIDPESLYEDAIATWNDCESENLIDRTSEFFTRHYLQDDILIKSDRASMLESLELRAPFLDNDLVAFAQRLPARFKYRRGTTKYLLRKAVEGDLPTEIVARPKKGFGIPLSAWLRELPEPATTGAGTLPLNEAWLSARWEEHRTRQKDWRHALWCWMTLRDSAASVFRAS